MPKMDCDAFPRASLAFACENPEQRSWKSRAHRSAQNPKLGIQRRKSDQEKSSKSSAKPRNPKWSSLESKATRKSRIQRAFSEDPQWSFDASPYFGIRSHIHRNPTRWRWQSKGQLMCSGIQKASPVLRNPERKKSIPESHWHQISTLRIWGSNPELHRSESRGSDHFRIPEILCWIWSWESKNQNNVLWSLKSSNPFIINDWKSSWKGRFTTIVQSAEFIYNFNF